MVRHFPLRNFPAQIDRILRFDSPLLKWYYTFTMIRKQPQEPVTKAVFKKEVQTLNQKVQTLNQKVQTLNQKVQTLNQKIDNVARTLLKNHGEFQELKKAVATKDDINTVLNRIDSFTTRIETFDRKVIVQGERLTQVETKLTGHENRIAALESK